MTNRAQSLSLIVVAALTAPLVALTAQTAQPGALVSVGEHRLFIACDGARSGRPTVVFEAGGGGTSEEWAAVRTRLGQDVRACAYDRAGLGRSEAGPQPRTLRQEAFELHALLRAAGEAPPYVLVGHSIGGLLVRVYAAANPDDVAGLVLVDPTHESAVLGSLRYGGMVRLREKATGRPAPEPRQTMAGAPAEDPGADHLAEEFQQIHLARQKTPRPLGSRPLVVLAAGKRPPAPPGIPDGQWRALRDERDAQVEDLAGLSTRGRFVRDDASGHAIHRDNPALVAQAIVDVLTAAGRN